MTDVASKAFISELKKQKKEKSNLLFLDNPKIIMEAIYSGLKPCYILKTKDSNFELENTKILLTDNKTIEQLSEVKTPQGVVAVIEYIPHVVVPPKGNFLVLDNVQDAGNVGTLIRSAYGADFCDIYLLNCAKVTSLKVIRSSAGSIFKSNVMETDHKQFLSIFKNHKQKLYVADMDGINIFENKVTEPFGLVIGNEGKGVSSQIREIAEGKIKLPMKEGLESLNAAVSGSIIMYVSKYAKIGR